MNKNLETELERSILEQQPMGGLEGFDSRITKIMDNYKEIN